MVDAKMEVEQSRDMADWDRAAWIAMWIPKFSSSAPKRFVDYNPRRKQGSRTDMIGFLNAIERNRKRLPKKLDPRELKRRFDAWVEKTGGVPDDSNSQ